MPLGIIDYLQYFGGLKAPFLPQETITPNPRRLKSERNPPFETVSWRAAKWRVNFKVYQNIEHVQLQKITVNSA